MNVFRNYIIAILCLWHLESNCQLSGTFTVPGSFPSIAAAINSLNLAGVNSTVVINIAANYTETAPVGGYTLTATGTATSPIVFQRNGPGANPKIYAYQGTQTPNGPIVDGVWRFSGSDHITIDGIDIDDPNLSNPSTMECGYCFYSSSVSNACQYNIIRNSTITLKKSNNALGTPAASSGSKGIEIIHCYMQNRTIQSPTTQAGTHSHNKFYGNKIENCNIGILILGSISQTFRSEFNEIGNIGAATGNTISNFGGATLATNPAAGIFTSRVWDLTISNNLIVSNDGNGADHNNDLSGIVVESVGANRSTIKQNTITLKATGLSTRQTGISMPSTIGQGGTIIVEQNSVVNCTFDGSLLTTFSGFSINSPSSILKMRNNIFDSNSSGAIGGAFHAFDCTGGIKDSLIINQNRVTATTFTRNTVQQVGFCGINATTLDTTAFLSISVNTLQTVSAFSSLNNSFDFIRSSASPSVVLIENNIVGSSSLAVSGNLSCIANYGTSRSLTIQNNRLEDIWKTNNGISFLLGIVQSSFTAGPCTVAVRNNYIANWGTNTQTHFYPIYCAGTELMNILSNTITSMSGSSNSNFSGLNASGAKDGSQIANNQVSNFTGGSAFGICFWSSGVASVRSNTIHSLLGDSYVAGIFVDQGLSKAEIQRNRIFDLSATTGALSGIKINQVSGTARVFNNLIGDLRSGASGNTVLRGIELLSNLVSTRYEITYNTVAITTTNNLVPNQLSCIYANTKVTLKNNILLNLSQAGPNARNSATEFMYGIPLLDSTSNNNLYCTGASTLTNRINFYTSPGTYNLFNFKTAFSPRESNSVEETTTFLSSSGYNPNFLKLNPFFYTQAESGAVPVPGIFEDYAGNLRNTSTPDIGAWEGAFLQADSVAPAINSISINNSCNLSSVTITANICDGTGVATGSLSPRCYFSVNSSPYISTQGTLVSGTINNGNWQFVLSYTANPNNTLSYFIVAQDISSQGWVSTQPFAGAACVSVNSVVTNPLPTFTTTLKGILSGTYTVGAAGNFSTLTQAVNAYNTHCLGGPVTFILTDPNYSSQETFPITFSLNPDASGTNSLLIIPVAGNSPTITNNVISSSVIRFAKAKYICLDGLNGGVPTAVINSSASANAVVILATNTSTSGLGCTNITIRNLSVSGAETGFLASGPNNDFITLSGNSMEQLRFGIYATGSSTVSNGGLDGWSIISNTIGPAANGSNSIRGTGIYLDRILNGLVVGNLIRNIRAELHEMYGIDLRSSSNVLISQNTLTSISSTVATIGINSISGIYVKGVSINNHIEKNIIFSIFNDSPSGYYSARGITLNTGYPDASSGNRLENNMVADIWSRGGTGGSFMTIGIALENQTGGYDIDHNTVHMASAVVNGYVGATAATALYLGSYGNNIRLRNNIFSNTYNNLNSNIDISYAVYCISNPPNIAVSNYNNYYVGGLANTFLGYVNNSNITGLASLQAALGGNMNSTSIAPGFVSLTDAHLVPSSNSLLDNLGTSTLTINTDVDNQPRNQAAPDMGADEFFQMNCSVLSPSIVSTASLQVCVNGTAALTGSLIPANGIVYQWQVATNPSGPYTNTNSAAATPLSLYPAFSQPGQYYFVLRASCSSNSTSVASNITTITVLPLPSFTITSNSPVCQGQPLALSATSGTNTLFSWAGPSGYSVSGPTVAFSASSISASGTYSLSVYDQYCQNSGTIAVSVINNTLLSSNSGPYCQGMPLQLNTLPALSYTWTGPNNFYNNTQNPTLPQTTPTMSGIYTLTAEVGILGCIASSSCAVLVNTVSQVSAANSGPVCPGSVFTLTASGSNSYTWPAVNGLQNTLQSPTLTANYLSGTTYTVFGIDANFCESSATTSVTVLPGPLLTQNPALYACSGGSLTLNMAGAASYYWSGPSGFTSSVQIPTLTQITTSNAGVYSVVGSVGTCTAATTVTLNVVPSPTVVATSNAPVCEGSSLQLSASGAQSYVWTNGNTFSSLLPNPLVNNVSLSISGTFTLLGTNDICSASTTLQIQVLPSPTLITAGNENILCAGESATLNASGASTYQWSTGETGAQIVVLPTATSQFTVSGSFPNGCTRESVLTLTVDNCLWTGTESATQLEIKVFPNPVERTFFITKKTDREIHYLLLNDILQTVKTGSAKEILSKVDISILPCGVYTLLLYDLDRFLGQMKVVKIN